jgi:DNA mismatch endonuclease (patch repair protein)
MGVVNEAEESIVQGEAPDSGGVRSSTEEVEAIKAASASPSQSASLSKPRSAKRKKNHKKSLKQNRKPKERTEKYARGTRSYTMSHIRGKDTAIEVEVRQYLFSRGLRFRKNDKRYPGHPDVVLPKWHVIVFVNGCFWHAHEHCAKHTMPKSNVEYWSAKLLRNRERDHEQHAKLAAMGWRVIDVWECELEKNVREERLKQLYDEITEEATTQLPAD